MGQVTNVSRGPVRGVRRRALVCTLLALLSVATLPGCGAKRSGPPPSVRDTDNVRTRDAGADSARAGASAPAGARSDDDPDGDDDDAPPTVREPGDRDRSPPMLEMEVIDECGADNEAGLSGAQLQQLKSGGSTDGMRYLYPYDGTVFPRGLKAPLLMWEGKGATAVYVRIRSQYFEYDGCLKPSAEGQLQLSQKVWDRAGVHTLGPRTPYTLELTAWDGSSAHGPLRETLIIAQATLKGSLYYNSYNSKLATADDPLAGALGIGFGAILRVRPGQDAEFFLRSGTCTGCHTVSGNGERLVAMEIGLSDGQAYELRPDTAPNPTPKAAAPGAAFAGLSPDGSVYISTAIRDFVGPQIMGAGVLGADSTMFETDTGMALTNTGLPKSALMPTFAPDGTLIVFNDYAQGSGRGLSVIDYDAKARKVGKQRMVYTAPEGYLGWPFVLPDRKAIVFTVGESADFSGGGVGINLLATMGPRSDLHVVNIDGGEAVLLARAMGFATPEDAKAQKSYLPFGSEELHQAYYPTVSPIASGGYFWVFFDANRHYGKLGLRRQLWGTALTIQSDGTYSSDPSHPAFYVSGQELDTGNHRAFAALDPCRADGDSCETGVDCCTGFCTDGTCSPPKSCSETDDACETNDDCCIEDDHCIAGFCGPIFVQ